MLIPPTFARLPAITLGRRLIPVTGATPNLLTTASLASCPECSAPLARASACLLCPVCGWGKCG